MTADNSRQAGYTQAEKDELLASYKAAMNLTAKQKAFAEKLRQFYGGELGRANKAGIIGQGVEAYHSQAWSGGAPLQAE